MNATEVKGVAEDSAPGVVPDDAPWTLARLFEALRELGGLRVIVMTPGSVFECLCEVGPFGVANGWLNAITDQYHWHIDLGTLRYARTRDEVHERSGRQVLYVELGTAAEARPSVSIYLHRAYGESWPAERLQKFARLQEVFGEGRELAAVENRS